MIHPMHLLALHPPTPAVAVDKRATRWRSCAGVVSLRAAPRKRTQRSYREVRAAREEGGGAVKREEGAAGRFSKRKSRYSKLTCSLFLGTMLSFLKKGTRFSLLNLLRRRKIVQSYNPECYIPSEERRKAYSPNSQKNKNTTTTLPV
jgi:hypothetical protein